MNNELWGFIGIVVGLGIPILFLWRVLWSKKTHKSDFDLEIVIIEDTHEHAPYWQIRQDQLIKQARTGTEQEKAAAKSELRRLNPFLNI